MVLGLKHTFATFGSARLHVWRQPKKISLSAALFNGGGPLLNVSIPTMSSVANSTDTIHTLRWSPL